MFKWISDGFDDRERYAIQECVTHYSTVDWSKFEIDVLDGFKPNGVFDRDEWLIQIAPYRVFKHILDFKFVLYHEMRHAEQFLTGKSGSTSPWLPFHQYVNQPLEHDANMFAYLKLGLDYEPQTSMVKDIIAYLKPVADPQRNAWGKILK